MSDEPTQEPWIAAQPGPRLLGHFARIAGWPYTARGKGERLPWPMRPGLWERPPYVEVLDTPEAEPTDGNGMVCTTSAQYLVVASYPQARWTTPIEVPGNTSTWGRLAGWQLGDHLHAGGTLANADPAWITDPLDVLVEVGVARARVAVREVPIERWACVQGWGQAGHLFLLFRVSEDRWMRLHSAGVGVQRDWPTTEYLERVYPLFLQAAVLRAGVPTHLRRPEE